MYSTAFKITTLYGKAFFAASSPHKNLQEPENKLRSPEPTCRALFLHCPATDHVQVQLANEARQAGSVCMVLLFCSEMFPRK